jgi:LacI family transcriptional regulator
MTTQPSRKATIKQVAEHAGVSIKTVSRVLNRERYVTAGARASVEAAMAALSFQPNLAARALAGKKSHQVALICDNPSPYYIYEVQAGVRARCVEAGIRLIIQPYAMHTIGLEDEIESLVVQTNPDGLILTPPITDNAVVVERLQQRKLRYVCISPENLGAQCSAAFIDNIEAAAAMVAHLTDLGHRRIGFIAGHPDYATSRQRLNGYRKGLQAAGIAYEPNLVVEGQYSFDSGSAAATALLSLQCPPTAIFASSDDMAAGALATAHQMGVRVPEHISIAGFDDTALAEVVWPPLTTIRQPTRDLAYAAADLLFADGDVVEHRKLPFTLIIRQSTAPPASTK